MFVLLHVLHVVVDLVLFLGVEDRIKYANASDKRFWGLLNLCGDYFGGDSDVTRGK